MSIAAVIADLVRAGVDPDLIGRAAEAMVRPDPKAEAIEKRKAKDRARKAEARKSAMSAGNPQESADENSLETKGFPTPLPKTQTFNLSEPKGSSRKLPAHVRADDFETFWKAYPRKASKADARKAFPKALAKIQHPDPLGVLLGGLERAKPGWTDPKFIPHPASWLNAERWNDEHPEGTQNGQPRNPAPSRAAERNERIVGNLFEAAQAVSDRRRRLQGGG